MNDNSSLTNHLLHVIKFHLKRLLNCWQKSYYIDGKHFTQYTRNMHWSHKRWKAKKIIQILTFVTDHALEPQTANNMPLQVPNEHHTDVQDFLLFEQYFIRISFQEIRALLNLNEWIKISHKNPCTGGAHKRWKANIPFLEYY